MKATIETVKIEMSIIDAKQLKTELGAMINDVKGLSEGINGYFDESNLREVYPKVNEFLGVLKVRDEMPF